MSLEQESKPNKRDWRIPRLIGARLLAAGFISIALLHMSHDIDKNHDADQEIAEIICPDESETAAPIQGEDCQQLTNITEQDNTNSKTVYGLVACANMLIVADTVSRYRRFRAVTDEFNARLDVLENHDSDSTT